MENPSGTTSSGGPSKGTLILNNRPSSRDAITRPRKNGSGLNY